MITNLAVSVVVSLVTNTTEIVPQIAVPQAGDGIHPVLITRNEPVKDPKEKWIVTTVSEVTTYSFVHNGQPFEIPETRELTNWTTHFVLVPPPPPKWIESTNNVPVPLIWPIVYPGMIR